MSDTPKGATPPPAGQPDKANGTVMVVVGCKLPNGLILEMGQYGGDGYTQVRLNGANSARVIGGYGMTNVSKDFWDAWYKKHKGLEFVKKGHVFVHADEASARDHAQERAELKTGLEPLDPMKAMEGRTPDGLPVKAEIDMDHFHRARMEVAQFGGGRQAAR